MKYYLNFSYIIVKLIWNFCDTFTLFISKKTVSFFTLSITLQDHWIFIFFITSHDFLLSSVLKLTFCHEEFTIPLAFHCSRGCKSLTCVSQSFFLVSCFQHHTCLRTNISDAPPLYFLPGSFSRAFSSYGFLLWHSSSLQKRSTLSSLYKVMLLLYICLLSCYKDDDCFDIPICQHEIIGHFLWIFLVPPKKIENVEECLN